MHGRHCRSHPELVRKVVISFGGVSKRHNTGNVITTKWDVIAKPVAVSSGNLAKYINKDKGRCKEEVSFIYLPGLSNYKLYEVCAMCFLSVRRGGSGV